MSQSATLPSGLKIIDSVEMRGITKRFPGVIANDQVDFDVKSGEIHALLGENGAGKSTLMKILYGLYQQNEGEILINGEVVEFNSPSDSLSIGIGMIHQHFMLVDTLTVAENVALGLKGMTDVQLDLASVKARLSELADIYGLKVNPDAYIWQLSVGEQQRVEIIKALYRGGALVILDEPTAVLTPQEVNELFVTLKQMREQGHALIFISHKLHEVQDLCDRVTVMRDGKLINTVPNIDLDRRALAQMMVGREVQFHIDRPDIEFGEVMLSVKGVSAKNDQDLPALINVSLDVRAGEIVGVAGVSGNGQRELAETISGLRETTSGTIEMGGKGVTDASVLDRLQEGLAFIPEERMRHGIIGDFSVAENAVLQNHGDRPYVKRGMFDFKRIAEHSYDLIKRYDIKTPSHETPAKNLSGGNIQKLILARELSRNPKVVIAAQPTRGVDISASEYIRNRLMEQRTEERAAILLISEDLDEVIGLSDRIAVLYEGEIVGIVPAEEADPASIGLMMAGVKEKSG